MLKKKIIKQKSIILFEDIPVRRIWSDKDEKWYFAIMDIVKILTGSINPPAYWRKLKERLKKEGNQTVTICHGFKMKAKDGKIRDTDCFHTENLFRIIQSLPSPKAEPFKMWLAKIGYERLRETVDPELAVAG